MLGYSKRRLHLRSISQISFIASAKLFWNRFFLDKELKKRIVKCTSVNEIVYHLQQRLNRLNENISEKLDSLKVRLAAHENFVQVIKQMSTAWELSKPLLIPNFFQVLLESFL